MTAYYNEHDPFAASWLRELIKAGHIPAGDVDERSIEDVTPDEIKPYTQCHFFAGIGGWPYALRLAGWPDDRPVWTGSAPCQPFSAAGKGAGFADERHLWPAFLWLISQQRPTVVFGEQVASKAGRDWFDVVSSDLEAYGYAVGAADLCAAGVGAPHIRQRLYFVADATDNRRKSLTDKQATRVFGAHVQQGERWNESGNLGAASSGLADAYNEGSQRWGGVPECATELFAGKRGMACWLADANSDGCCEGERNNSPMGHRPAIAADRQPFIPRTTNGFWRDADWLFCRDGKWRPAQSIVVEMADGLADRLGYSRFGDRWSLNPLIQKAENRVGRLRGYGNAIVPPLAAEFIGAYMDRL